MSRRIAIVAACVASIATVMPASEIATAGPLGLPTEEIVDPPRELPSPPKPPKLPRDPGLPDAPITTEPAPPELPSLGLLPLLPPPPTPPPSSPGGDSIPNGDGDGGNRGGTSRSGRSRSRGVSPAARERRRARASARRAARRRAARRDAERRRARSEQRVGEAAVVTGGSDPPSASSPGALTRIGEAIVRNELAAIALLLAAFALGLGTVRWRVRQRPLAR